MIDWSLHETSRTKFDATIAVGGVLERQKKFTGKNWSEFISVIARLGFVPEELTRGCEIVACIDWSDN